KGIERLLIERAIAEFERAGVEQITSEALVLGDEKIVRDVFTALGFGSVGRMVMSLPLSEGLPEPVLPPGYELVPWDDRYLREITQLIFDANCGGPDRLIYPELRTLEGTGRMVQGIRAGAVGPFNDEASPIVLHDGSSCGTILFTRPAPDQGFVAEMAVTEEHRGKGLGKALLVKSLAIAQGQGIRTVKLGVTEENLPAVGLYRKLGFIPEQRLTAYIRGGV
ncbi:MAG: GNAT family N-acetyltransferase, partial [Candidatus Bipolaricaulia bacterium]